MYIGIDLGTTNVKAAIYNEKLQLVCQTESLVKYESMNGFIEFDAEKYFDSIINMLSELIKRAGNPIIDIIVLTGQAESLVCVGENGRVCMNAISWMDERSIEECKTLRQYFSIDEIRKTTGQVTVSPTWPATKILWLQKNSPEVYKKTRKYMLLKDFIVYRLTGICVADMSIATFSCYFNIYQKCYWNRMLEVLGISENQLPPLIEPCSIIGDLKSELAVQLGQKHPVKVNVGTLDHFSGMIGTGNISPGEITLSIGTVMGLSLFSDENSLPSKIALHYGFIPDTYILLPVAESGGVSLEWFKRKCMPNVNYEDIDKILEKRNKKTQLLFLPYIVGTNAPEYDKNATGVFWGLRQEYDAYDMAQAIMEGVAFMLRKNCDYIKEGGTMIHSIIATGGGAKSDFWCQLLANVTGIPVLLPKEKESASFGAAIIAAVSVGQYSSYEEACENCVSLSKRFLPNGDPFWERKYQKFCALYQATIQI